ncbi:MAG: hypothetical protein HUU35_09065, partial [Armatimonadetes bacterium]|nr:hypothetical protein [Armatimonadota bacterium]
RSPMAEALARRWLVEHAPEASVEVGSAGFLDRGQPTHPFTLAVLKRRGIEAGHQRSRTLTPLLLLSQPLILAMDEALAERARALGATRAHGLSHYATEGHDPTSIDDPIGKPLAAYEALAIRLENLVPQAMARAMAELGASPSSIGC